MSDTTLNAFVASVADSVERLAFVPSPPTPATGPSAGYFLLQRDDSSCWTWDADAVDWVPISGGGGVLPATVQGDMLFATAANTIAALAKDANATRYLSNTGGTNNPAWAQINLANGVTGDLPFANLTQGSALSVLGVTGNATADNASITAGTDGFVLRRSGTAVAFGTLANGAFPAGIQPFQISITDIAHAAILTLPTTPVTLVAAPAAGTYIRLHSASLLTKFAAGAYTNVATTTSDLRIESSGGVYLSTPVTNKSSLTVPMTYLTTFFDANNRYCVMQPYMNGNMNGTTSGSFVYVTPDVGSGTSDLDNKLVRLAMSNAAAGDLTGGNAANTLRVIVYYTVETLP